MCDDKVKAEECDIDARFDKQVLTTWPACAQPIGRDTFDSKGLSFGKHASPVHWSKMESSCVQTSMHGW